MKLSRFATVYLKRASPLPEPITFRQDNISVAVQDATLKSENTRLLMQVTIDLEVRPRRTSRREIVVPEGPRKAAEAAIETIANVLSVFNHCRRQISSPYPFVALCLESHEEVEWASDLSHFIGAYSSIPQTHYRLQPTTKNLTLLADRMDGVSLLAEAIAQEHATGKFHEFMRLFERAFALSPSQFEKKLTQFLEGADLGYSRPEIKSWIELRNPATHANDTTRPYIALESHVRPLIARIEQASYDVLLNKREWATNSKERRNAWRPAAATTSPITSIRATKGADATFIFQVYDPFNAFVYDAGFQIPVRSPELWSSWDERTPADANAESIARLESPVNPLVSAAGS